jgi:hypothetical protein
MDTAYFQELVRLAKQNGMTKDAFIDFFDTVWDLESLSSVKPVHAKHNQPVPAYGNKSSVPLNRRVKHDQNGQVDVAPAPVAPAKSAPMNPHATFVPKSKCDVNPVNQATFVPKSKCDVNPVNQATFVPTSAPREKMFVSPNLKNIPCKNGDACLFGKDKCRYKH